MCHQGPEYNKQRVSELLAWVSLSFSFIRIPTSLRNLIITSSRSDPVCSEEYYIQEVHLGYLYDLFIGLLISKQVQTKPRGMVFSGTGWV